MGRQAPGSTTADGTGRRPRRLRRIFALDDLEPAARELLPAPIFGYVSSGTETNASLRNNRGAFDCVELLPRVLRNVSARSQACSLLGRQYRHPFGIAPMGVSALTAYRGDVVLAESARRAGIPMIMSGASLMRMEDVARADPDSWFQAYLPPSPERIAALVDRAERAGFDTLVVTVDSAVRGNPEHHLRAGFTSPLQPDLALLWQGLTHPRWSIGTFLRTLLHSGMPHFENSDAAARVAVVARNVVREFSGRSHLDWADIARIRDQWRGRFVLKGILHPADGREARARGIDGIIVSNHGGRQLDGAVTPLRMIAAMRSAVGDLPLMVDSGFRRGTDVLKAIALGADFVFVGRPFNYAAALAGHAGVAHAVDILAREIDSTMGLLGINTLDELGPDQLVASPEFSLRPR